MAILFQPTNTGSTAAKTDTLMYTTHPNNNNLLVIRRSNNNNNNNNRPEQTNFLKDCTPGTTEREEVFDNKKVKIKTTTTIDKVNGETVITVVEESKYHISKKTRTIRPDGTQELSSESKNKVKACKMPAGFAQKYLSSHISISKM